MKTQIQKAGQFLRLASSFYLDKTSYIRPSTFPCLSEYSLKSSFYCDCFFYILNQTDNYHFMAFNQMLYGSLNNVRF